MTATSSLFERVTKSADWPAPLRAFHDPRPITVARGTCTVTGPRHWAAWTLHRLAGLPDPGDGRPIVFTAERRHDGEIWTREVGGRRFRSRLSSPGPGRLVERVGPASLCFRVTGHAAGFRFDLDGVRLCGMPLPRALWPRIRAAETFADGEVRFDVAAELPWAGPLVSYRGALVAVPAEIGS